MQKKICKSLPVSLITSILLSSCVSYNDAVDKGATADIDVPGAISNIANMESTLNEENIESRIDELGSQIGEILESLPISTKEATETEKQTDSEALAATKPAPLDTAEKSDFDFEIHFVDMGQADCSIILSDDQCLVFDAGSRDFEDNTICEYLDALGVDNVDYLILSHWDIDHYMQADEILNTYDVKNVLYSPQLSQNTTVGIDLDIIEAEKCNVIDPVPGTTFMLGDAECTIIAPTKDSYEDINDSSIAILIKYGIQKFLFTGDAELEGESDILKTCKDKGINIKNCTVYQAGHHGSNTASSDELLDLINPKNCVISCGIGNEYYHPHMKVLNKLKERKVSVYRTDEQGSIVCKSDGASLFWNTTASTTWQAGNGPLE